MKKIMALFLGCILVFAGCAGTKDIVKDDGDKANAAIKKAKEAIADAKTAGAEKYAKELIGLADSDLTTAQESFNKKDYDSAVISANKATTEAIQAKAIALAGTAIDKAKDEIKDAIDAKADKYAPELLASAQKSLDAAVDLNTKKDYEGVLVPAKKAYDDAAEALRIANLATQAEALIAQAKVDIGEAEKAKAEKCAADLLKAAKEELKLAETSYDGKDYLKAIDNASKASADAKSALAACSTTKYSVKPGDCLWNIAKSKSGFDNPFLWPLIWKANRDLIKNPDLIYAAQNLVIPTNSDDSAKKEAITEAAKYK